MEVNIRSHGAAMSLVKLDTQVRREQIARAALALVASHGMRGLRMAELARQVGLVPSAIYRHFKSKHEVLDAVLDLLQDRLTDNVNGACRETSDPLEQLKDILVGHVRLILEYQAMPRILFSEEVYGGEPQRKARLHSIVQGYLDGVAGIVRQGQRDKRMRPELDPGTVAVMFLGLFQPSAFLYHLTGGRFDVSKYVERAWQIFSEVLRAR